MHKGLFYDHFKSWHKTQNHLFPVFCNLSGFMAELQKTACNAAITKLAIRTSHIYQICSVCSIYISTAQEYNWLLNSRQMKIDSALDTTFDKRRITIFQKFQSQSVSVLSNGAHYVITTIFFFRQMTMR